MDKKLYFRQATTRLARKKSTLLTRFFHLPGKRMAGKKVPAERPELQTMLFTPTGNFPLYQTSLFGITGNSESYKISLFDTAGNLPTH